MSIAIVKYNGKGGDVVIPDTIDELPVTTIKKFAFARFGKIFQITYPGSKIKNLTIGNNPLQLSVPTIYTSLLRYPYNTLLYFIVFI